MCRKLACFASIVVLVGLLSPLAIAQEDERYDFDGLADVPGDFNKDGTVDGNDFLIWQQGGSPAPLSQSDLADWEDNYGTFPADPTDWMTTGNWSDGGVDPFGEPFGPLLPDFGTRVELEASTYGVNAPVIGPGDTAEAFGIRIGRSDESNGEGLLTMTGGTLTLVNSCSASPFTCNRRLRVGAAQVEVDAERFPGTFNLSAGTVTTDTLWIGSGSRGTMNMSDGVVNTRGVFYMDWTWDGGTGGPAEGPSVLNMTGGTINVGTFTGSTFRMHRNSNLNLDGGDILINGAVQLGFDNILDPPTQGAPAGGSQVADVTVTITDGLLRANGLLQIGGSITVNGGILRAGSFEEVLSTAGSTVDINGGGLLQFRQSNESVVAVEALITAGWFTTMDINGLEVTTVGVSGTDFTQVAVAPPAIIGVPEPSSVVLAMLVSVSMVFGGRNFRGKKVGTNQFS